MKIRPNIQFFDIHVLKIKNSPKNNYDINFSKYDPF